MHQFMCHKYLTFDFGPQINFIIGTHILVHLPEPLSYESPSQVITEVSACYKQLLFNP